MLSVSFNLTQAVAMLIGIVLPVNQIEVDGLNSPTARPIPGAEFDLVMSKQNVKGAV